MVWGWGRMAVVNSSAREVLRVVVAGEHGLPKVMSDSLAQLLSYISIIRNPENPINLKP